MECADKRSRAPKLNTGDAPKLGKAQDPWQVTFLILVLVVLLFAWCPPASVYATLGLFLVFIIAFLHALWPMMVFYHEDCKHTDHKRPAEEAPTKLCRGSQISLEVGGIEEIEAPISAEDITSPAMECADKRSGAPKLNTGDAPKLGKAQNPCASKSNFLGRPRQESVEELNTGDALKLGQVGCILCLTASVFMKWPTSSLAFAFASCFDLILLFLALRKFECTSKNSNPKIDQQLKITVLFISIHLIGVFSHRVASVMPLPATVIIWSMSITTIGAIIYLFFYHEDCEHADHKRPAAAAPTKLCCGSHDNNNHED